MRAGLDDLHPAALGVGERAREGEADPVTAVGARAARERLLRRPREPLALVGDLDGEPARRVAHGRGHGPLAVAVRVGEQDVEDLVHDPRGGAGDGIGRGHQHAQRAAVGRQWAAPAALGGVDGSAQVGGRAPPFRYAGVAKEFPTAPTDSFVVANAGYVARATGSDAVGTFLVQTDGSGARAVAGRVRRLVSPDAKVTDIQDSRRVVGSNLTAVELSGLTRVELAFALVLAAAASGLALGLGFRERRRTYAIAVALGARRRQLGGFVWGESAFVTAGGLGLGAVVAAGISLMLVKVLTGVFDPPPAAPAVPWAYLAAVVALTLAAAGAAGAVTLRALRRPAIEELRDL
jgi:FtsX-like permease family